MTLFYRGPNRIDIPDRISQLVEPLLDGFRCSEVIALNVWRLLEEYEHLNFDLPDLDRDHDICGRGEIYERKKEAAELTLRALETAFGNGVPFKTVKDGALRAVLCEAHGVIPNVKVIHEEVEMGRKFFKEWYRGALELRERQQT